MKSLAGSSLTFRAFHLPVIGLAGMFVPAVHADLCALHVYESDQQLALRVPTRADAMRWAAQVPRASTSAVEVRPLYAVPVMP